MVIPERRYPRWLLIGPEAFSPYIIKSRACSSNAFRSPSASLLFVVTDSPEPTRNLFAVFMVGRRHPVIEVPYLKGHQPHFVVVQSPDFKVISDLNAILSLPGRTLVCPATNASFVWQVSLLSPLSPSSHCPTASSSDHTYSSSLCHIGSVSRNSAPGPS